MNARRTACVYYIYMSTDYASMCTSVCCIDSNGETSRIAVSLYRGGLNACVHYWRQLYICFLAVLSFFFFFFFFFLFSRTHATTQHSAMIFFHLYNRCYISQFCTDDNSTSISTTRWNRGSKVARSCHEQNDQFNIVIIEHVMYEHEQQTGFYHFRTISKDEIKNSKGWQRMDYRVNWIFAKIDKMLLTSVTNLVIIAWYYSTDQKLQRLRTIIVFAYCWNASFASVIFFVLFFPFSFFLWAQRFHDD